MATVIGVCVGRLDVAYITHVHLDFVVVVLHLQLERIFGCDHGGIVLAIVDARIGGATRYVQACKEPKNLLVELVCGLDLYATCVVV